MKGNVMRWLYIFILLILFTVLVVSCSTGTAPEEPEPGPTPQPGRLPDDFTDAEKATASSINTFGLKLFLAIHNDPLVGDTNLFISPLSVSFAFGMVYNGANGETREEMQNVLELNGMTLQDVNDSYYGIMEVLTSLDPDVILNIANSVWYQESLIVSPDYLDLNQRYFNAEVYDVDFGQPWVADTVNHWIDVHTNGMITRMVDPPLDPSLITLIINAIYFKGMWTHPFDTSKTHETTFFRGDGETIDCEMMSKDSILPFLENDLFTATHLPYGNKYYNMMLMLPKQDKTVSDIIDSLTNTNWDLWRNGFSEANVMMGLPKLNYEYGLEMKDILMGMGMERAFTPGSADFSNMFPNMGMWLDFALHKAKIRVDEFGTEAAAVTVIGGTTSMSPQVYCNKPFIFVIYEKTTGTILFIGKVKQPVWED